MDLTWWHCIRTVVTGYCTVLPAFSESKSLLWMLRYKASSLHTNSHISLSLSDSTDAAKKAFITEVRQTCNHLSTPPFLICDSAHPLFPALPPTLSTSPSLVLLSLSLSLCLSLSLSLIRLALSDPPLSLSL